MESTVGLVLGSSIITVFLVLWVSAEFRAWKYRAEAFEEKRKRFMLEAVNDGLSEELEQKDKRIDLQLDRMHNLVNERDELRAKLKVTGDDL